MSHIRNPTDNRSERGHLLTWRYNPIEITVVCMEIYCKWYGLHLIHPNGRVEEVPFPSDLELGTPPYCDHVPNPMVVQRWTEKMNYLMCDLALELIIGRWEIEYKENYNL